MSSATTLSEYKKDEPALSQQSLHNAEPFRIQRLPANGLASATIPVRRVVLIAFFSMEVGVYPRALHAFVLLSRFVGSRPISLRVPPQSSEDECEPGWRLGRG